MVPFRRAGLVAFLALLVHPAAAQTDAEIRRLCRAEWPLDYSMQEYCIGEQRTALRQFGDLSGRLPRGSEEQAILRRCKGEWRAKTGGYDWGMVVYCATEQLGSYRRLQN